MVGSSKHSRAARGWLTSFGDLLTLLLCFFLLQFSTTPKENSVPGGEVVENHDQSQEHATAGLTPYGWSPRGTLLAKPSTGSPLVEREFRREMFSQETFELNEDAGEELKNLVIPVGYEIDRAFITTCGDRTDQSESLAWTAATGRALSLQRQLVDVGISQRKLEIEVLGPHCSRARFPNVGERFAGLLSIKLKAKTRNG